MSDPICANCGKSVLECQGFCEPKDVIARLKQDCLTMALRLYGEDPDTFSPETAEVMDRWRPRVEALLNMTQVEDLI